MEETLKQLDDTILVLIVAYTCTFGLGVPNWPALGFFCRVPLQSPRAGFVIQKKIPQSKAKGRSISPDLAHQTPVSTELREISFCSWELEDAVGQCLVSQIWLPFEFFRLFGGAVMQKPTHERPAGVVSDVTL